MYSETGTLVDDVSKHYDNTDLDSVQDADRRRDKLMQFVNRTRDEIWYTRSWNWTQGEAIITMVDGKGDAPADYGQVGVNGGLYDRSNGRPWIEINYQEMVTIRKRSVRVNDKLFAIGVNATDDPEVMIANTGSTEQFDLVYKKIPVKLAYGENIEPMPIHFGQALLLGTVTKVKEEEGDPRPLWREDYQQALSRAMATEREAASRVQQMPMAVGRKW